MKTSSDQRQTTLPLVSEGSRVALAALLDDDDRSRPIASNRPPTATIRLSAAPTKIVLSKPRLPISSQPPLKAPTAAPSVFSPYSQPIRRAEPSIRVTTAFDRKGSEHPMRKVGHSRPANTTAKITRRDEEIGSSSR